MIKRLESKHIGKIAKLHKQELSGFLPELGEKFLEHFYKASLELPGMFTFVEEEDGEIRGFVSSIIKTEGMYKKVIFSNPVGFGVIFLRYFVTHPDKITKFIRILAYPGFREGEAELLSIAVDRSHRKRGIGKGLFKRTAGEFKKRGIKKFKISVYDRLPANGFYLKIGCRKASSFQFLDEWMNYYEYGIFK